MEVKRGFSIHGVTLSFPLDALQWSLSHSPFFLCSASSASCYYPIIKNLPTHIHTHTQARTRTQWPWQAAEKRLLAEVALWLLITDSGSERAVFTISNVITKSYLWQCCMLLHCFTMQLNEKHFAEWYSPLLYYLYDSTVNYSRHRVNMSHLVKIINERNIKRSFVFTLTVQGFDTEVEIAFSASSKSSQRYNQSLSISK